MADEQVKYTPEDLEQAKEHNGHKKGCPASRIMIAGLYCESCLHTAALIAQVRREEQEKVDLVKKWEARMNPDEPFARAVYMECADELREWLAVNLPRIKAEADRNGCAESPDFEEGP